MSISVDAIAEAARVIDPVFRDSPQFVSDPLSEALGMQVVVKVECLNPIRSFKGRGTDYLLHRLGHDTGPLVAASAGNLGQGPASAGPRPGGPPQSPPTPPPFAPARAFRPRPARNAV